MNRQVLIDVRDRCMVLLLETANDHKDGKIEDRAAQVELMNLSILHSAVCNHLKSMGENDGRTEAILSLDSALGVLTDLDLGKAQLGLEIVDLRMKIHHALAYLEGE